jgi:baseplate J-like protein
MDRQGPKIDPRQFSQLLGSLQQMVSHYTPEWSARDAEDAGVVLLKIFARIAEQVIQRLNRTPDKNFVAFLDMLGISLLPARPARVPVQFRLAAGTPGDILIPARTQLAAETTEQRPEPLPFETEQALQASASPLLSVLSVDPTTDTIYKPPPGFLDREFPSDNLPAYALISFSEAGSKTIQLDRIDELQEGDYLKIGQGETVDYLIIKSIAGRIVTVTDALQRNYAAATRVEKITRFHVFEGKDHQEHILYLGHPDLFNIKSSARFTLNITHIATTAGLQRLRMVWEYWGGVAGQKGEDWQACEIESDTSLGFSQNGTTTLRKPEGEIKEREINAITSRWLRCRLIHALPVREFPILPALDAVTFVVESAGDPQLPDQAFHNDTPLDVALPFFPFGVAPRLFDSFYLASKEAFSKKNARIEINVRVDTRKILATPAAVLFHDDSGQVKIKAFARGIGGRLIEVETADTLKNVNWLDHQFPPDTRMALPNPEDSFEAIPSVVEHSSSGKSEFVSVFVKTKENQLAEFLYKSGKAEWMHHRELPEGGKIKFDLCAVCSNTGLISVFVVGIDGRLYIFERNPLKNNSQWRPESTRPRETDLASAPYAAIWDDRIKVFVRGQNGKLYEWDEKNNTPWTEYELSGGARVNSAPFAQIYQINRQYFAKVFVIDDTGRLHVLDTRQGQNVASQLLHSPSSTILIDSNPHGFIFDINTDHEKRHIFVRGTDNHLWEWTNDQNGTWKDYQNLDSVELHLSPSVMYYPNVALLVFSSTNKNSLLQAAPISHAQGGGSNGFITLRAETPDQAYEGLQIEVRTSPAPVQVRQITHYDGSNHRATVDRAWDTLPDQTSEYEIWSAKATARAGTAPTITLAESASATDNAYNGRTIHIVAGTGANQEATIVAYSGADRIARINPAWGTIPDATSRYRLDTDHAGTAQAGVAATITLATTALAIDGVYEGLSIEITAGSGRGQSRLIKAYNGTTLLATVAAQWETVPDHTSTYRIGDLVGVARAGTPATVTLAQGASSSPEAYEGHRIRIVEGTGLHQEAEIIRYDGTRKIATVKTENNGWGEVPDSTSVYQITVDSGTAQGGANQSYISLNSMTASEKDQSYQQQYIEIVGGKGSNQGKKRIASYSGGEEKTAVVEPPWESGQEPDSSSRYRIEGDASWIQHNDPNSTSDQPEVSPKLSWEYWNSRGWVAFKKEQDFEDGTKDFLIDGTITYILPDDIEPTEVSGQENYWIRARLVGGDYGRETFLLKEETQDGVNNDTRTLELVSQKDSVTPPQIFSITIRYRLTEHEFPKQCLTFNNLDYIDQTSACQTSDKWFAPFATLGELGENDKGMYLGFAQRLAGGPVRVFFAAQELSYSEQTKPVVEWRYRRENEWQRLSYEDATEGLIQQEILTLLVPQDFARVTRFGESLFWVRGSLVQGEYSPEQLPVLSGIFPNTAWAFQAETITEEILGSSDGEANQILQFFKASTLPTPLPLPKPSVLPGEIVRVREALSGEERAGLLDKLGERAVHDIIDAEGKVLETWVLWLEVSDFFTSTSTDRHYTLDRATGQLQFGDGRQGRIPPAGTDNIQAFSYQAGGGVLGNVAAGQIQTLVTAIAGVEATNNPVAADGGADTATLEAMLKIGPAMISHRNRAVTAEDFEWLARDASNKVVKARCLPNTDNNGRRATGWVNVIIVPQTNDAKPQPSFALQAAVRHYLQDHCANHLAAPGRITISGPEYVDIDVEVTVVVDTIDVASQVETAVRENLQRFLHPLTGGLEGTGWEFGRAVPASDVYVLLERIPGVDHVEALVFRYNGNIAVDLVPVRPNALVASGNHRITVELRERR